MHINIHFNCITFQEEEYIPGVFINEKINGWLVCCFVLRRIEPFWVI